MAEIGFVVQVPNIPAAQIGNMISQSFELERDIAQDLPSVRPQDVRCIQIGKTDDTFVLQMIDKANVTPPAVPSDRTSPKAIKKTSATIAGAAAGNHTVTGVSTKNTLIAVVHVDDASHVGTDKTSEYTISAKDTINNTGGTSSASAHVVVAWV